MLSISKSAGAAGNSELLPPITDFILEWTPAGKNESTDRIPLAQEHHARGQREGCLTRARVCRISRRSGHSAILVRWRLVAGAPTISRVLLAERAGASRGFFVSFLIRVQPKLIGRDPDGAKAIYKPLRILASNDRRLVAYRIHNTRPFRITDSGPGLYPAALLSVRSRRRVRFHEDDPPTVWR